MNRFSHDEDLRSRQRRLLRLVAFLDIAVGVALVIGARFVGLDPIIAGLGPLGLAGALLAAGGVVLLMITSRAGDS